MVERSGAARPTTALADIICMSHLRWDFVYQRPNHLMGRAARERRVFFVEEPIHHAGPAELRLTSRPEGATVAVPVLPDGVDGAAGDAIVASMLADLVRDADIRDHVLWYYTPVALRWTGQLQPSTVVFDSMDELSAFADAPAGLAELEAELLRRADVVFTGGRSLHEAKVDRHPSVHLFPSSVDVKHFARARRDLAEPDDQAPIARPRLGYFGVIDERMDLPLLQGLADARPDWQIVMVGPVVKIREADLPTAPNLHWLGRRGYDELPAYLAGWDVALMPFARNEATRFISPTKTPEYLAAGRPVVSTSIHDVVFPYGRLGLVRIADDVDATVRAIEAALAEDRAAWLSRVDTFLADQSWDRTWSEMSALIEAHRHRAGSPEPLPRIVISARPAGRATSAFSARQAGTSATSGATGTSGTSASGGRTAASDG
jgi:UDP-galactopyranose mutase